MGFNIENYINYMFARIINNVHVVNIIDSSSPVSVMTNLVLSRNDLYKLYSSALVPPSLSSILFEDIGATEV